MRAVIIGIITTIFLCIMLRDLQGLPFYQVIAESTRKTQGHLLCPLPGEQEGGLRMSCRE